MRLITILLLAIISTSSFAHIGSKSFAKNYFGGSDGEKKFLADYVSTINAIQTGTAICILNCEYPYLSTITGFYRNATGLHFGQIKTSFSFLPESISTSPYLPLFYSAIVDAMIAARTAQDSVVFIEELGGFELLPNDGIVFHNDISLDPDYAATKIDDKKPKDPKDPLPTSISGVTVLQGYQQAYTWEGTGYIRLTWETGIVCYPYSRYPCYEYHFSLAFKQVGESSFGRPIYCRLGWHDTSIWLAGAQRGGITVWVENSLIAELLGTDITAVYSFPHQPYYWK